MTHPHPPKPQAHVQRMWDTRPRPRQRGSVYLLVLGVCSIVMVIGMSAMAAVRIQFRDTAVREDATQAQQLADAALQIAYARLDADGAFRSTYTHDTWTTAEATRSGMFQFKLVDQIDTDLSNRASDDFRLVVRATCGNAVRLASVLIPYSGAVLGAEMVTNGDAESGNTGFFGNIDGTVVAHTDSPHGGSTYLQMEGRSSWITAWNYELGSAIQAGNTYRISAWMRNESSATQATLGIYSSGGGIDFTEVQTTGSTSWYHIEGDVTPGFTFTPTSNVIYGRTTTTNQDLHFDDVSVRQVLSNQLPVVRGSYRRELDP